ncbi:MAG: HNH endonuclease [Lentisphaerales bacterium]|nr:HNH endonuclease [Lentisphaerales bacterium]
MDFSNFFSPADEKHVKKEKEKAREMRKSQWWKNQCGKGQCNYCKAKIHPKELTLDHVVPIIRGGKTTKGNCVPCCKECNSQKKYLLPIEWQEYLNKLQQDAKDNLK